MSEARRPRGIESHEFTCSVMRLHTDSAVAVVLPQPIGDSLIGLVLVNNLILIRNGYRPVVFGWVVEQFADWLPDVTVGQPDAYPAAFDTVIELRPTDYASALSRSGHTLCLANLPEYGGMKHMIERVIDVTTNVLHLSNVTCSNGLTVPPGVVRGRFAERVVIHPTGSHPEKMWSRAKFLALSRKLGRRRFAPSFLVAPIELAGWDDIVHAQSSRAFAPERCRDVDRRVGLVHRQRDSGLGHLASLIDVPTLTLFMRRGLASSWRPGWGPGAIVLPPSVVPSGALRERLWTQLLTVGRVMSAFRNLQRASTRTICHFKPAALREVDRPRARILPDA